MNQSGDSIFTGLCKKTLVDGIDEFCFHSTSLVESTNCMSLCQQGKRCGNKSWCNPKVLGQNFTTTKLAGGITCQFNQTFPCLVYSKRTIPYKLNSTLLYMSQGYRYTATHRGKGKNSVDGDFPGSFKKILLECTNNNMYNWFLSYNKTLLIM